MDVHQLVVYIPHMREQSRENISEVRKIRHSGITGILILGTFYFGHFLFCIGILTVLRFNFTLQKGDGVFKWLVRGRIRVNFLDHL